MTTSLRRSSNSFQTSSSEGEVNAPGGQAFVAAVGKYTVPELPLYEVSESLRGLRRRKSWSDPAVAGPWPLTGPFGCSEAEDPAFFLFWNPSLLDVTLGILPT